MPFGQRSNPCSQPRTDPILWAVIDRGSPTGFVSRPCSSDWSPAARGWTLSAWSEGRSRTPPCVHGGTSGKRSGCLTSSSTRLSVPTTRSSDWISPRPLSTDLSTRLRWVAKEPAPTPRTGGNQGGSGPCSPTARASPSAGPPTVPTATTPSSSPTRLRQPSNEDSSATWRPCTSTAAMTPRPSGPHARTSGWPMSSVPASDGREPSQARNEPPSTDVLGCAGRSSGPIPGCPTSGSSDATLTAGSPTALLRWPSPSPCSSRRSSSIGGIAGLPDRAAYPRMLLVRALEYAKEVGAAVYGIGGRDGGYTAEVADACICFPLFTTIATR